MSSTEFVPIASPRDDASPPIDTPKALASLRQLFVFADTVDCVLMALGSLAAIGTGVSLPMQMVLYGDVVNAFNPVAPVAPDAFRADVNRVARNFAIVGAGVCVAGFVQVACWSTTASRQTKRLRSAYVRALLSQDVAWFDTHEPLELATRVTDAAVAIQNGIGRKFGDLIRYAAMAIAGVAIALVKGWALALVLLAFTPVIALTGFLTSKRLAAATQQGLDAYGQAGAIAQESLSSIRTVHMLNAVPYFLSQYDTAIARSTAAGIRKGRDIGWGMGLMFLTTFCTYAGGLFFGAVQVANDRHCLRNCYDGGRVVTVFFTTVMGGMALGQAGPSLEALYAARSAAADVFQLLHRTSAIDARSTDGLRLSQVQGLIELSHVDFAYPSRPDVTVCRDYSLTIRPGATVALVGPSGSGKSTIVALLERFYDPQRGTVTLDGVDLRRLNVAWLRQQIGLVSQEPVLFATSILENIRCGRPTATDDEVIAAAKQAFAYEFIQHFPDGLATDVGERGAQLSGGQKQRIAIARAILQNPSVLVLDEATSALDAESERLVQQSLDALASSRKRTTLIIAHRLSTIRHADAIAVIDNGRVVELGTHDELLAVRNGHYRRLVGEQEQKEATETPSASLSANATSKGAEAEAPDRSSDETPSETVDDGPSVSTTRLWRLSAPEWKHMAVGSVGALVHAAVFPLWGVLLTKMIVLFFDLDQSRAELLRTARYWALGFVGLGLALCGSLVLQHYGFAVASERLVARVRRLAFAAMLKQEIAWFDDPKNASGALVTRLATDAATLQTLTADLLNQGLVSVTTIAVAFALAFHASWEMTLVLVATCPLFALASLVDAQLMSGAATTKTANDADAHAGAVLAEAVTSIRTVASLRREEPIARTYSDWLDVSKATDVRSGVRSGLGFGLAQGVTFFNVAFLFYLGGRWVASGRLTFEALATVVTVVMFSMFAVGMAAEAMGDQQTVKRAVRRVFRVIDRVPQIDATATDGATLPRVAGAVAFHDVAFAYPSRPDTPVYTHYSLEVAPGETLALVGASGSGKSTAVALLERFYDPTHGSVTLDGHDLRTLQLPWLRDRLSVVGQEPVLFAGTIADNIALGRDGVTRDEIEAAAAQANALEFIAHFPDGFDTRVGDHGVQVSGGQKQRIAIARALVRQPDVLVLDEATSALDAESERLVQQSLDRLVASRQRTTLVIAHRLSTIRHADRIAVIGDGGILEMGTHDDLVARPHGAYRALVAQQRQA